MTRRYIVLTLALMVMIGSLVAREVVSAPLEHTPKSIISTASGLRADMSRGVMKKNSRETEHYIQNFENGWEGWTTFDRTFAGAMWHLSQFNAHGADGYSWWMADPEIGGYWSGQYTYLDTPQIMVSADNHTLTFNINWSVEDLGNLVDPNDPNVSFNGWDGVNVRISTNNGETWSVISGQPAYNSTSMFSFGRIHGEGPGIAGWGGSSNGWVNASFDLANYIGQNVKIRFAFASDNAKDSSSNPELYSAFVDNISLGDFSQDFNDGEEHGMTYGSKIPTGGNLWRIGEPIPPPTSPPFAAMCQNDEGTYNKNMWNYITSPLIEMPSGGDIRVDVSIGGSFLKNNPPGGGVDNCNYWGFEVSPDSGKVWYPISNPYNEEGGNNWVYADLPTGWSSFVNVYTSNGIISDYAGQSLMFRFYFKSNDDDPVGPGLMLDDFIVYHDQYLPAPTNLTVEEEGGMVHLSWESPGVGGEEGWIHWDSGENADGVGINVGEDGGQFDVAARFFPADMEDYIGGHITKVRFFPRDGQSIYKIRVWTGLGGTEMVREQAVSGLVLRPEQWNELELEQPVKIEMGEHYWIGYNVHQPEGAFPAGTDAGPAVADRGDMIKMTGGWNSLHQINPNINCNWNIQALVETLDGTRASLTRNNNAERFELDGYKVYRSNIAGTDYQHIGTVETGEITIFTDIKPVQGMVNYYVVTGIYGNSESGYTNEAKAFVPTNTSTELVYDDGECDSGFNVGVNNQAAVHFDNEFEDMIYLTHVKMFIETKKTSSVIIFVWREKDDAPGTVVSQFIYPVTQVEEGWNYIPIPPANPVTFTGEGFFIGTQETNNASKIGLDEDNTGSTYTKTGGGGGVEWTPYTNGNLMIRAIVDSQWLGIEGEEMLPSTTSLTATNYPNPFNPDTKIQLNIPQTGEVNLSIYNIKGQLMNTLVNDVLSEGQHTYVWNGKDSNGRDAASGIYFYRVEFNKQSITKRMVLLK